VVVVVCKLGWVLLNWGLDWFFVVLFSGQEHFGVFFVGVTMAVIVALDVRRSGVLNIFTTARRAEGVREA
jgi:hypothetical protein